MRFNSHDYTASVPNTFVTVAGNSEPASVTVSDTLQGNLGTFSDNAVIPYTRPASCPADPAAYTNGVYSVTFNNTASINETPDQASASATLTCYAPLVSKDAQTEWFRSVDWTIAKDVTPASADAFDFVVTGDTHSNKQLVFQTTSSRG